MTGTDIREALEAVADSTPAPAHDRLALRGLVRRERRRQYAGRAGVAAAVAAAVAVGAVTLAPFVRDEGTQVVAPPSDGAGSLILQGPVYVVLDRRLTAVDPLGRTYDLGVRAEEVVGATSEAVWFIGDESGVQKLVAHHGNEGPQGAWSWERVPSEVDGPVQSAHLSADGRYLGWVDRDEVVHVRDLLAGSTETYTATGSVYLSDVAQGTGLPLVHDDEGVRLLDGRGREPFPSDSWAATASRDRIAVPYDTGTVVYRLEDGRVDAFEELPGAGRLSPYGEWAVSVTDDGGDAGSTVRLATLGEGITELAVPGRPFQVGWGDDDTVLVASWLDGTNVLVGCEALDPTAPCVRLDVAGDNLVLGR